MDALILIVLGVIVIMLVARGLRDVDFGTTDSAPDFDPDLR